MHARAGPSLARSMSACALARCAPASISAGAARRARGHGSWSASASPSAAAAAPAPAAPVPLRHATSSLALPPRGGGGGGAGATVVAAAAAAGATAAAAAAAASPGTAAAADPAAAPAGAEQQQQQHHHHRYARGPPSDDDYSGSSTDDAGLAEDERGPGGSGDDDDDDDDDDDPPPSRNPRVEYLGAVDGARAAMLTARGRLMLPLDSPEAVYAVLSDYDRCPEVFSSTVVHARSERLGQGEGGNGGGDVTVVQGAKWRVLGFSGSFDVRLTVKEDPLGRTLVFTLVESAFLKGFEGRWAVRPRKGKGGGGRGCVVEHVLAVEPVVALPRPIAAVASVLFTRQIHSLLGDLRKEMERQRWHGGGEGGGGGGGGGGK